LGVLKKDLFQASCLSPCGPAKAVQNGSRQFCDFLGYQFGEEKITVSKRTLESHIRRLTRLYEQNKHQPNWKMLLDDYRQHWVTWVNSGIPLSIFNFDTESVNLRLLHKST
jgi:RNA-directed DNA polymerase